MAGGKKRERLKGRRDEGRKGQAGEMLRWEEEGEAGSQKPRNPEDASHLWHESRASSFGGMSLRGGVWERNLWVLLLEIPLCLLLLSALCVPNTSPTKAGKVL